MRLRLLPLLASAAVGLLAAGCGGSEAPVSLPALASFSQSAQASADATTGRFTFAMEMELPGAGEPLELSGEGAFDASAGRAAFSIDLSAFATLLGGLGGLGGAAPDAADWRIEAVQDGDVIYLRVPFAAGLLPAGASWVRVDAAQAARLQGFDLQQLRQLSASDPRDMLRYLEAVSGRIETVGEDEVRGIETVHYRATIDLRRYAELFPPGQRAEAESLFGTLAEQAGLSTFPVDVWIDAEQRVRRVDLSISATQPGTTQSFEATVRVELFAYGEQVGIAPPPPGEVVDAARLGG